MNTNCFYHGDCLFVMKHDIPTESIDLIYLDPPFFTGRVQKSSETGYLFKWINPSPNNKNFTEFLKSTFKIKLSNQTNFTKSNDDTLLTISDSNIIIKVTLDKNNKKAFLQVDNGSTIELRALKSNNSFVITKKPKWYPDVMPISYNDSNKFWKEKGIHEHAPEWLKHLAIDLKRPDFASYLYYMMKRLQECSRILKPTGSIYLHCDRRGSHYLKMIMDEIFEYRNFMNDISWCYSGGGVPKNYFANKHDNILFYAKDKNQNIFNLQYVPYSDKVDFHFSGEKYSETEQKRGKHLEDWWIDIKPIHGFMGLTKNEIRTPYPTQKPTTLLRRIIQASSEKNQVVLDPFCGCGSTVITAHGLNRKWIGIDINEKAFDTISGSCNQMKIDNPLKPIIIERTLDSVLEMINNNSKSKGQKFERWVNEFYSAIKPIDKGVDGITPDGIPIQTKTFKINDTIVNGFYGQAMMHRDVPKPLKIIRLVSGEGYTDNTRQARFEIENKGVKVELFTPEDMLNIGETK